MALMRYLIRLLPGDHSRESSLRSVRAVGKFIGVDVRNPKWTSYGGLEVDLFAPGRADLDTFLAAVEPLGHVEWVHDLSVAPSHKSLAEIFQEARAYFNSERYWECHEVLEEVWRQASGKEKSNLQGAILVCAAFVHHQKGEREVALGLLKRALRQLHFEASTYNGLDVASLKQDVERIVSSGKFEIFRI